MSGAAAGAIGLGHDARYFRPDAGKPLPRRRARRGWRRFAAAALQSLLAIGVLLSGGEGIRRLRSSQAFALRRVIVEGCSRCRPADLQALVLRASGRNLLDVDLCAVRCLVESSPWVRTTEVHRRLPDTILLTVTERRPAAVALLEGRPMLVDGEGVVLAECGTVSEACDFPVLRGLDGLPDRERASRIVAAVSAVRTVERVAPSLGREISEVDLSRPDRLAVQRASGGPPLLLSPEEAGRNLENYLFIHDEMNNRFAKLEYVDLRFRGRIAVLPAAQESKPRAAGARR